MTGLVAQAPVTDAQIPHILRFANIERLELTGPLTDCGLEGLSRLTRLVTLSVSATAITDLFISNLVGLPGLQLLDLSRTALTDVAVPDLARLTALRHLNLRGTKISSDAIVGLDALPHLRSLALPLWTSYRARHHLRAQHPNLMLT